MRFPRVFRIYAAVIATSVLSGADAMCQSNGQVTFHVAGITASAPVRVVAIKIGEKNVSFDQPVTVSGRWLRDVTIELQNGSTKTIVSGGVILTYPETGDGSPQKPMISTPLILGRRPDHAYLNEDGSLRPRDPSAINAPLTVLPEGKWVLSIGPNPGDLHQTTASEAAGGAITQITIQPSDIYFSDDSLWFAGKYFMPIPAPERYRAVSQDEFRANVAKP